MADDTESRVPHPSGSGADVFQPFLEHIREIVWIYDLKDRRVVYVNPAYERITGRSADEIYAGHWNLLDHVYPLDRARVEEEVSEALAKGGEINLEFRIVRADGEIRWVWVRGGLIQVGGDVRLLIGVTEDITPRKQTELALETSLSLLRATLDATTDGILALDNDGRISLFNTRFVELWRIPEFVAIEAGSEEQVLGHITSQLLDPAKFRDRIANIQARPHDASFDVLECADGRVYEVHSRPERIGDDLVGRVWSFHDNTARALRERTRRLELQSATLLELARQPVAGPGKEEAAFRRITETAAEMLRVDRVGIWYFEQNRTRIRLHDLYERKQRRHTSGTVIQSADAPSYFAALDEERALAIHEVSTDSRTTELSHNYCAPLGISSMLDVPIRAAGAVIGVVCFEHVGPSRVWTVEEQSFAASIGDLVTIALEVADRERTEWNLRFLAEGSGILASSLDYVETLRRVARLAVPVFADWCVVDVVEDGQIRRIAAVHADPVKEELLRGMIRRYPPRWDSPHPAAEAIRTGTAQMSRDATESLAQHTVDETHREMAKQIGITSYIATPMVADHRNLGAMTFVSAWRRYDEDDLAVAQDIAYRAATAIHRAQLFERAEAANRAKSNFLAVMSHELRTPLTAIMGYTELLRTGVSGPLNDKQRDQLQHIAMRSQDLLRIVEEILAYARFEMGTEQAHFEPVDLGALLREVAELARPLVEEHGLELRTNLPEQPSRFITDAGRLKHIVLNLLSNAATFTKRGVVELDAEVENGSARIRVRDTGAGIAPADQERIFEPFVQVEEAMTREKGGTGLGLAAARRLARLLGGDIFLESEPGRGSTFTVDLPSMRDRPRR